MTGSRYIDNAYHDVRLGLEDRRDFVQVEQTCAAQPWRHPALYPAADLAREGAGLG